MRYDTIYKTFPALIPPPQALIPPPHTQRTVPDNNITLLKINTHFLLEINVGTLCLVMISSEQCYHTSS